MGCTTLMMANLTHRIAGRTERVGRYASERMSDGPAPAADARMSCHIDGGTGGGAVNDDAGSGGPGLELRLSAQSDRFDADDESWLAQEADLLADLRREVGGVRRDLQAVPGVKGMVETVIMALGSA